jgi:hypothetical protein
VRFLRAAGAEVIGLFVGDWVQTGVSVAILAVGWFLLSRVQVDGVAFVVALALAAQLVYATTLEARATTSPSSP